MQAGSIARSGHRTTSRSTSRTMPDTRRSRVLLLLFLGSLLIPLSLNIGPMRLTPYRVLLLVLFVPMLAQVLGGRVGRVTATDWLVLLYGFWIFVALLFVHGSTRIPYAGISSVELLGGYLVGRVLVRDPEDYRKVFRILMVFLLCLLPFSIMEAATGKLVIPDLLRSLGETPSRGWSAYGRMGLERVYSVFDHPILYGLFCSVALANFALIARTGIGAVTGIAVVLFSVGLSLSAGPLLAVVMQCFLLGWYWVVGGRWKTLMFIALTLYILFLFASERSLASFVIEKFTFNSMTGWVRLAVFKYGWQSVMAHPFFGIGLGEWARPGWVTDSVDNFWLLNAMRYGLPGGAIVIGIFLSHFVAASLAPQVSSEIQKLRNGHLIALAATAFTLVTVHIWGSLSVFIMFYIGAGSWLYTRPVEELEGTETTDMSDTAARGLVYTRFPLEMASYRNGDAG